MDEWHARGEFVYGRDGSDVVCVAWRRRMDDGVVIGKRAVAKQIAAEHTALAEARAHVEALVAFALDAEHQTIDDPDMWYWCEACERSVCISRGEHHADDCPVAAARRWLAGDVD